MLFAELSELTGQRNAIDGRIVEIVAEMDHDELCGMTGARSVPALVAWKTGVSPANAATIATVAHRLAEFPRCAAGMRDGRLSLDQVGVIAERGGQGSDAHYAELAAVATVSQLRTAVKLEPRPDPDPRPERRPSISKTSDEKFTNYRLTLPHLEAAEFDAALASHHEALIAQWKRDHDDSGADAGAHESDQRPPMPTTVDGFMALVEAGWDAEVARRPHGQRTTVVMHLDVKDKIASLHLGPLLSDADRRYLTCDATCEAWFERDGQPIGSGRTTRHDQPAAAPRPRASRPDVRGARLRGNPWSARPSHPTLGRRRVDRVGQPGAALSVSPSVASPRGHHHHRPCRLPVRRRQ